MFNCISE